MTVANDTVHCGGCLCGAMRYSATFGASKTAAHCHCDMCRKVSGGTFTTWVEFQAETFRITNGDPVRFRSSDLAERMFCGRCGCQLTFHAVGDPKGPPGSIWITLGSLDRPDAIEPTQQIFTDNQLPWLHLSDALPQWSTQMPWIRTDEELPHQTTSNAETTHPHAASRMQSETRGGGCLCGSIRYRYACGGTERTGHCHCHMCRKSTGATLVSWTYVPSKSFDFVKGKPTRTRSSRLAERTFCGTCGCHFTVQAMSESDAAADDLRISVGSHDRPQDLHPSFHMFTNEKLTCNRTDDGLNRWPNEPANLYTRDDHVN